MPESTIMIREKKISNYIIFLIIIFIVHFVINVISVAFTNIFSFDGGLNAQVAQNISSNFSYSSNYDGGELFPSYVQTGIPVLLPVSFMFSIFGVTFESGLLINSLYLLLLFFSLLFYLKKCLQVNNFVILLFCILFYATRKLFVFGFGLYGEVPTLFFIILSIIFLHLFEDSKKQRFLYWIGVSLGLGFLTKTVALISIPAFIFYFIHRFIISKQKSLKEHILNFTKFVIGFFIPILIFEIYRYFLMGNLFVYLKWWGTQINNILMQAGVKSGFEDSPNLISKIFTHLEILSISISLHPIIILIILVLVVTFVILMDYFNKGINDLDRWNILQQKSVLVIFLLSISYFGWWLIITPTQKAWHRRIFNGTILLEICFTIIVFFFLERITEYFNHNKLKFNKFYVFLTLNGIRSLFLIFFLIYFFTSGNHVISFFPSQEKIHYQEATTFISSLPEKSEFFGFDWMQAPLVSFVSQKKIYDISFNSNINNPGPKENKYFVIDKAANTVAKNVYESILEKYDYQEIFKNDEVKIFNLLFRKNDSYEEFSNFERNFTQINVIDFSKDIVQGFYRGVYSDEIGQPGKWAQKLSGYLLKRSDEKELSIKIWIPDFQNYDIENLILDIYLDGTLVEKYSILKQGQQLITIPINNIENNSTIEVTLFFNSRLVVKNDMRELAFRIIYIELQP